MSLYFVAVSTLYVKATLYFPSCDLLWLFKEQTQGLNLRIHVKQNTLSGLFLKKDLEIAVKEFSANYTEAGRFFIERTFRTERF